MAMANVAEQKTTKAAQMRETPRITGEAWKQTVYQGPVRRCFFLSSRSTPGMEHRVVVEFDGDLRCDCVGFFYRGNCAHREVVAAAIAEEAKRIAQAQVKAEVEAERGWRLTAKGRRALEQWRKAQEERETTAVTTDLSQRLPRRSSSGARARNQRHDSHDDQAEYTPHPGDTALLRRDNQPFSLLK